MMVYTKRTIEVDGEDQTWCKVWDGGGADDGKALWVRAYPWDEVKNGTANDQSVCGRLEEIESLLAL